MPVWMWGAYVLAVARLTGLLAFDEITRPVREGLLRRLDTSKRWHRSVAYLAGGASDDGDGCPWCLSIWVAGATAPVAWHWGTHPAVAIPVLGLAASQLTGMISGIGRG